MRLGKYLAHAGVASRRKSEAIIAAGRVTVDGRQIVDPAFGVPGGAEVRVDGAPVEAEPREVWMVNKPLDVVSTADEPGRRQAVVDLVPSDLRLYPVGRLDVDSSGLILITNDGELANRLSHPRYEVPKTYRVKMARPVTTQMLKGLAEGVELDDGPTAPAEVRKLGPEEIEITIREGRNRQVRRMAEAVRNRVTALERTGFGSLRLGRLPLGRHRLLDEHEVGRLWKDAGDA
ncbi:MAG: pseudouridine synthase [Solirubrobacterales bacterium]